MFNPTEVIISTCVESLIAGYRQTFGNRNPDFADFLSWTGNMALENIANSDALYHNVEHTVLVTLVGQEILRSKCIRERSVSCSDWLHFIISCLYHDIGYVKGVCRQDRAEERMYATGLDDVLVSLPFGSTDAILTPFHIDRGKLFIDEHFCNHELIDTEAVKRNIELTRFPVPADEEHLDTASYSGLVRAADLIGQLSDPRYLQKISALFYEFEETGANKLFGYRTPGDVRSNYPNFYWNVVFPYIQPALSYLELTRQGQQIIANLHANVFRVEHEQYSGNSYVMSA